MYVTVGLSFQEHSQSVPQNTIDSNWMIWSMSMTLTSSFRIMKLFQKNMSVNSLSNAFYTLMFCWTFRYVIWRKVDICLKISKRHWWNSFLQLEYQSLVHFTHIWLLVRLFYQFWIFCASVYIFGELPIRSYTWLKVLKLIWGSRSPPVLRRLETARYR